MIKIYHNPRCSKSRQALELLENKNIKPEIILYLQEGLSFVEVENILDLLKCDPRDIMRKKEAEYKEFNLGDKSLSDEDLIKAIVKTPKLLERPIIIHGQKAVIGRPTENILDIL
jgi:arsenate reductase